MRPSRRARRPRRRDASYAAPTAGARTAAPTRIAPTTTSGSWSSHAQTADRGRSDGVERPEVERGCGSAGHRQLFARDGRDGAPSRARRARRARRDDAVFRTGISASGTSGSRPRAASNGPAMNTGRGARRASSRRASLRRGSRRAAASATATLPSGKIGTASASARPRRGSSQHASPVASTSSATSSVGQNGRNVAPSAAVSDSESDRQDAARVPAGGRDRLLDRLFRARLARRTALRGA